MADANRSVVARAAEKFAAYTTSLLPASSSSSTPSCDVEKISEDTKRLARMLDWIRPALDEVENMKINSDFDRYWLKELQGVADDVEDVLDDFLYEAMHLGLMEGCGFSPDCHGEGAIDAEVHLMVEGIDVQGKHQRTGKAPLQVCYQSSPSPPLHEIIAFLCAVEQRVKKIDTRFDEIKKNSETLRFMGSYRQRDAEVPTRQPTSSLIQKSDIFGRDEDLETLKKFLLSDNTESTSRSGHVAVMAIVGMGGLGKTTLAQLAYSDTAVNMHFPLKSWVCVSEGVDLIRLTEAMFQSLNLETSGMSVLDPLQRKLEETLARQRFLLVLDDIWDVESLSWNWNQLTAPLRSNSEGSKIIITSRNEAVSTMINGVTTYHLPCLKDGDCLKLLIRPWAFAGWDLNLYQNLIAVAEKIAKKCRGLPLVAKTLGGLLHTTDDEGKWKGILESDVWNNNIQGSDIIPILELSYQYLPVHLKRCFRFCSVFPKDYEFDRDQLIWMWMALGYIKANGKRQMEDIGKEYFDDLLSRSFFQYSQRSQIFLMHDLIHDLARCISGNECCSVEDDKSFLINTHVRHFSVVTSSNRLIRSIMATKNISLPGSLRSFLINYEYNLSRPLFHDIKLLNDFLTRMEHLRVLDLKDIRLSELPDSISHLKHLRYLHLQFSEGGEASVLKLVVSLYHLQTLDFETFPRAGFSSDRLELYHLQTRDFESFPKARFLSDTLGFPSNRLPDSILNLLNLRHLTYKGSHISFKYPKGIRTNLQTLPGFHVSPEDDCAKLTELKDMNNIKGRLKITGINNLTDVSEAKDACLDKKKRLLSLTLSWEYGADASAIDNDVLESLKPNPKLEELHITEFKGQSHPSWLGDGSLSKLARVELHGCRNWIFLPPLGQLPSLKWLSIWAAIQVDHIGHEFFYGGFPQLKELTLWNMDGRKSWCGAQKGECPQLQRLTVGSCKDLESLTLANLESLQHLEILRCPKLKLSSDSLQLSQSTTLQKIKVVDIQRVKVIDGDFSHSQSDIQQLKKPCLQLEDVGQLEASYVLGQCSHICHLTITNCANIKSPTLGNFNALTYGKFSGCRRFKASLSLETSHIQLTNVDQSEALPVLNDCPCIRRLTVSKCANLTTLPLGNINALECVEISECPQFQFSNEEQLSPTLQVLCIKRCPSVTEYWCKRHPRQRSAHLRQSDIEDELSLYLVFWNVLSACDISDCLYYKELIKVRILELEWDYCINARSNAGGAAETMLEKLRPNSHTSAYHLDKLVIRGYMGSRFATWVGDPSFDRLFSVTLLQCSQCKILPPLGQLPFLMKLYVEGASRIKHVGREFFDARGDRSSAQECSFPCLQRLEFHDMPSWEEWRGAKEGDFPLLRELILKRCPRLRALPLLPPKMTKLVLEACEGLTSLSLHLASDFLNDSNVY